jgi:hypothetical protein
MCHVLLLKPVISANIGPIRDVLSNQQNRFQGPWKDELGLLRDLSDLFARQRVPPVLVSDLFTFLRELIAESFRLTFWIGIEGLKNPLSIEPLPRLIDIPPMLHQKTKVTKMNDLFSDDLSSHILQPFHKDSMRPAGDCLLDVAFLRNAHFGLCASTHDNRAKM